MVDLDFSGGSDTCMDFPPLHLVLPSLFDSFGNPVTLQDEHGIPALPNLKHLSERTSTPVETYNVYSAQTNFRFSFYGTFSPEVFSVPLFPDDEARWIQEPAQRFPATLLLNTKKLILRGFDDLRSLFPLVRIEAGSPMRLIQYTNPPVGLHQIVTGQVSREVREVYLIDETFAHYIYPHGLIPNIVAGVEQTVKQFPNLRNLHLPDPLKLQQDLRDVESDDMVVLVYKEAVNQLSKHAQASIRDLRIVQDQDFDIVMDLPRVSRLE